MYYITKNYDISALPLSIRIKNCLKIANIHTIGEMLNYPINEFINIRNMGEKSFKELQDFIQAVIEGRSEFVLVEESDNLGIGLVDFNKNNNNNVTGFLDINGVIVKDILIKNLPLSVRAINSLSNSGYVSVSQLVNVTYSELMSIKNMGKKTAEEVLEYLEQNSIRHGVDTIQLKSVDLGNNLSKELSFAYGENERFWKKEILSIKSQFPEAIGETLIYRIYDDDFIRGAAKAKILKIIEENGGEISKKIIEDYLPYHLGNTTIVEELLLELEFVSAVEIKENTIRRQYLSIVEFASQIENERERKILQLRLEGNTFQEIGEIYGITRERVRQITNRVLKKKPYLREDKYDYIFNNYKLSIEDFTLAFDESAETYYYLDMICTKNRGTRKDLDEILTDTLVSHEYRKKAENVIYKQYVLAEGVHIKMSRPALIKHFVKTYCKNLTDYDDFFQRYNEWLDTLEISKKFSLVIESRTYENILNRCNYVLWNHGRSFRYYNIPEYNFEELLTILNLDGYENIEFSSMKLFRENIEIMKRYDIRDEYELHNLLKKIWPAENKRVKFKKMPTINIDNGNSYNQVLSLLLQYSPISTDDLAKKYEEEYGVKDTTVKGSYLKPFDDYCAKGIYSIDFLALPTIQYNRMKEIIDRDFYTIQEIKRLYKREFPNSEESLINSYNLKRLDFRVYSGYVIKNKYASASDYFRYLLTHSDIVDANNFIKSMQGIFAYNSELYRLKSEYEIVEFAKFNYINIRRLNEVGITKEDLKNYCKDVADNYEKGEYFTVISLQNDGFTHKLDDYGFDEWFYSSVLIENKELFSYQRIGGNLLFLRGKASSNLGDMITWLLGKHQKIDIYDLIDLLKNHYGIKTSKDKLRSIIDGTELYYDSIMESVYIDYDTYFEEI